MINFLLKHPEIIEGTDKKGTKGEVAHKGNLRIWTKFFSAISGLSDFDKNLETILNLGSGSLPKEHVTLFVQFVKNGLDKLPTPFELFTWKKEDAIKKLKDLIKEGSHRRQDIAGILTKRMVNYAITNKDDMTKDMINNYTSILESKILGPDLVLMSLKKIAVVPELKGITRSKDLMDQMLGTA